MRKPTMFSPASIILRRLSRAILIASLAATCVFSLSHMAQAAEDEEEDSFETRFFKGLLGIGDGGSINYRERPPLVVPPSTAITLPPPPNPNSIVNNPAWPKDADVAERKARKAAAKQQRNQSVEEQGRPLSPGELARGTAPGAGRVVNPKPGDPEFEGGRPVKPSELGYKGGLFDNMFKGKNTEEYATFTSEPTRSSLTEPPTGYRTPSSQQPYGVGARKEALKPYNIENRGTDSDGSRPAGQ